MKLFLLLTPIFLITHQTSAQPCYIQKGTNIVKVENCNTDQIKAKEWTVRLYKKGAPKTGNSYWGTIKAATADEVMAKLKSQQDFELRFNNFIGKGSVQDDILTHFNPLGPIAIIDETKASELPLDEAQKKIADQYEKAVDLFYTGLDVKNNLDVIVKGKENPYADIGSNFMQYAEGLKDAVLQIRLVQNLLNKSTSNTLQNINKQIKEIDNKLNDVQAKQTKIISSTKDIKSSKGAKVGNAFYIFLTTTIEIKPKESQFSNLQSSKTIYIISKPLLHKGSLTDDMLSEKEQFIADLEKHFIDKPDLLTGIRNKSMEVHYGKPYSTEVSKTSDEGYKAIEAYKNTIKETLEGLAQFDFLEL